MRFKCHCGNILRDTSDRLPYKARLIPDQLWDDVLGKLEKSVLGALAEGTIDRDDAEWRQLEILLNATRVVYQCPVCGRLYVAVGGGRLECYAPETADTAKDVLGEPVG